MLRLITDFDGPIVDVSERYYQAYRYCLAQTQPPDHPLEPLPKAEFWTLKRSRTPETEIGKLSGLDEAQAKAFSDLRRRTVHTLPYFEYDVLAPGAVAALEQVQQTQLELVVMTMRRVRELEYAFEKFDLNRFFPETHCYRLSNDYVKTRDIEDKPKLMARALAELPPASETWMVGDTEADIAAAKQNGIKVIAVLCGIRDRTQLERYEPDWIVANLQEAVDLVLSQTQTKTSSPGEVTELKVVQA